MSALKSKNRIKEQGSFYAECREDKRRQESNRSRGSRPEIETKPQNKYSGPPTSVLFPLWFVTMNTIIQTQLDRVETALNTLIESIASYNPSIPAANALLAADDDLNNGLKQCMDKLPESSDCVPLRDVLRFRTI